MRGIEIQNHMTQAFPNNTAMVNINNSFANTLDQPPVIKFKMTNANDPMRWNRAKNITGRIVYLIASIVIFPLGLARLAGYVINHICVKKLLIPATGYNKSQINKLRKEVLSDPNISPYVERVGVKTIDKVTLDTVLIKNPSQQAKPIKDQKFILFFNGNGGLYEHMLENLVELSLDNKVNIYTGNYRGVGPDGFPTSCADLEKDGVAMVEYLLSLGVQSENIMIHGWSLGGGVGAHVARHYQNEGHEIHYCNDRSFSSLIDEVHELAQTLKKDVVEHYNSRAKDSRFIKILQKVIPLGINILLPLVKGLIHLLGWNFKSLEYFKSIKGRKVIIFHRKDEVIPYRGASLYWKLKNSLMTHEDRVEKLKRIKLKTKLITDNTPSVKKLEKRAYHPENVIRIESPLDDHVTPLTHLEKYQEYKDKLTQVLNIEA